MATLAVGAIGVVYGDIGTSPLYALKEVFVGSSHVPVTESNVMGVLSLVFWALFAVVALKYVIFMMRADNRGEGGIMALMALSLRHLDAQPKLRWTLISVGLLGASLFYGDGIITPAISVLSAVEGIELVTPVLKPYVIPVTIAVLVILFLFQYKGTAKVGAFFGPIMCLWFLVIAIIGVNNILTKPGVLAALDPRYALEFLSHSKWQAFVALGAIVLTLTGAEALYADMGHFGKDPIRLAWIRFVFPALTLNYLGQGALLLQNPKAVDNPFFLSAPAWALLPMVVLATVATVIASQAVISGTYSLTRQAIQLGYCPRMLVSHTSEAEIGQIYLPWINWALLAAVVGSVIAFGSSSNLAAAYGIAVTGTMLATTILAFFVVRNSWHWGLVPSVLLITSFLTVDLAFFGSNLLKIREGGWFPLVIGAVVFVVLSTWRRGRELLWQRLAPGAIDLEPFLRSIADHPPLRVPGTAIFLTAGQAGVPHALLHNLNHNKVLHERIVLLTVRTGDIPHVPAEQRIEIKPLGANFFRLTVHFGFKDEPDLPRSLELAQAAGMEFSLMETSFFLSRQTLVATENPGMALWREKLFVAMSRNAASATGFFRIPTNRVVELGTRIEL